jgi:hypothetical protein
MGLMPNHCDNTLVITGPDIDIRRFIHITKCDEKEPYVISQHMPIPVAHKEADHWYEWCVSNWGTKWGDYDTQLFKDVPDEAIFHYQTAWGPYSDDFLKKISVPFPTLTFLMQYEERGMGFLGVTVVSGGELLYADSSEPDLPEYNEDDEDAWYDEMNDAYLKEMDRLTLEAEQTYETNTTVS